MKELNEFLNWAERTADNGISERALPGGIQTRARPANTPPDRGLQKSDSIINQARRKYPGRDDMEALALYSGEELAQAQQRDLEQNKLINAQSRENRKLNASVAEINREIQDFERHSDETDREVRQIKQASGQLKTDIETRRVGRREVEAMLADLEQLKTRSNVDPKQYKELEDQIAGLKNLKNIKPEDFEKFQKEFEQIKEKGRVEAVDVKRTMNAINHLEQQNEKLAKEKAKLKTTVNKLLAPETEERKQYNTFRKEWTKDYQPFINDLRKEVPDIKPLKQTIIANAEELKQIKNQLNTINTTKPTKAKSELTSDQETDIFHDAMDRVMNNPDNPNLTSDDIYVLNKAIRNRRIQGPESEQVRQAIQNPSNTQLRKMSSEIESLKNQISKQQKTTIRNQNRKSASIDDERLKKLQKQVQVLTTKLVQQEQNPEKAEPASNKELQDFDRIKKEFVPLVTSRLGDLTRQLKDIEKSQAEIKDQVFKKTYKGKEVPTDFDIKQAAQGGYEKSAPLDRLKIDAPSETEKQALAQRQAELLQLKQIADAEKITQAAVNKAKASSKNKSSVEEVWDPEIRRQQPQASIRLKPFWKQIASDLPAIEQMAERSPKYSAFLQNFPTEEWREILANVMAKAYEAKGRDYYAASLKRIENEIILGMIERLRAKHAKSQMGQVGGAVNSTVKKFNTPDNLSEAPLTPEEEAVYQKRYQKWAEAQDLEEHFWDLLRASLAVAERRKVNAFLSKYTPEEVEAALNKVMADRLFVTSGDNMTDARGIFNRMVAILRDNSPDLALAQKKGDEAIARAKLPESLEASIENLFSAIIGESVESLINEKKAKSSSGIQYRAQVAFPDEDPNTAVALYVARELEQAQIRDAQQSRLINAQSRENRNLRSNLKDIEAEITDVATDSQEVENELKRLRSVRGEVQGRSEVSRSEIAELMQDIELLKSKPGIGAEQIEALRSEIENLETEGGDVETARATIEGLLKQNEINKAEYDKSIAALKQSYAETQAQVSKLPNDINKIKAEVEKDLSKSIKDMAKATSADITKKQIKPIKDKQKTFAVKDKDLAPVKKEIDGEKEKNDKQTVDIGKIARAIGLNLSGDIKSTSKAPSAPDALEINDTEQTDSDWVLDNINATFPESKVEKIYQLSKTIGDAKNIADEKKKRDVMDSAWQEFDMITNLVLEPIIDAPSREAYEEYLSAIRDKVRQAMKKAGRSENSIKTSLKKIEMIAPAYSEAPEEKERRRKEADRRKEMNKKREQERGTRKKRADESLPKAMSKTIDALAENILGAQYAKYLK